MEEGWAKLRGAGGRQGAYRGEWRVRTRLYAGPRKSAPKIPRYCLLAVPVEVAISGEAHSRLFSVGSAASHSAQATE